LLRQKKRMTTAESDGCCCFSSKFSIKNGSRSMHPQKSDNLVSAFSGLSFESSLARKSKQPGSPSFGNACVNFEWYCTSQANKEGVHFNLLLGRLVVLLGPRVVLHYNIGSIRAKERMNWIERIRHPVGTCHQPDEYDPTVLSSEAAISHRTGYINCRSSRI
jgi:hypothetical protein